MSKKKTSVLDELVEKKVKKVKELQKAKEQEKEINKLANDCLIKETIEKMVPALKKQTAIKLPKYSIREVSRILCVVISDVHIGKKANNFDYTVFLTKLQTLFSEIEKTVREKNIEKVVLFVIGDIVDGEDIYPGHSNFICMPVAEQSIEGARDLSIHIDNLSDLVPVEVKCVAGNHGRDGKKGEKTRKQNWDSVLFHIMRVHLKNNKNVSFEITDDWKLFVTIGSIRVMAFHGDDVIKGNPLANLPKAIVAWGDMWRNLETFDIAVCGHFHLPICGVDVNGRTLFVNGSFSPPEDYTEQRVKSISKNGQISFIIENGTKIVDRNLIEL